MRKPQARDRSKSWKKRLTAPLRERRLLRRIKKELEAAERDFNKAELKWHVARTGIKSDHYSFMSLAEKEIALAHKEADVAKRRADFRKMETEEIERSRIVGSDSVRNARLSTSRESFRAAESAFKEMKEALEIQKRRSRRKETLLQRLKKIKPGSVNQ